LSHLYCG